jgi:Icc-related predicted phosphoesterase
VDLVISCGDLPYYYLEFIVSMLNKPLYYVRGNHASKVEIGVDGERSAPWGAVNLHRRSVRDPGTGLLMAGIEGSLQYNYGPYQYSQAEMAWMAFWLVPGMLYNKLRYGRYLDILVTHAPPWKIGDMDDLPHRGIKAFNWLIHTFQPAVHLHGHIHIYRSEKILPIQVKNTQVINTFGYREFDFDPARPVSASTLPRVDRERRKPDVG